MEECRYENRLCRSCGTPIRLKKPIFKDGICKSCASNIRDTNKKYWEDNYKDIRHIAHCQEGNNG